MKAVLLRACMLFCRIFRSPDVEKANLHFLLLISIATIILSVVLCTLILCTPFFWVNNSKGLYPKTGPLHSIYILMFFSFRLRIAHNSPLDYLPLILSQLLYH